MTYDQGFALIGSAFTGDRVDLQIRRMDQDAPIVVDAAWNVAVTAGRITAIARPAAVGVDIVPGLYAASVRVERWRTTPSGTRRLESSSNETPFAIAPRIDAISVPDAAGQFTVNGSIFQHLDLPDGSISLFVGPEQLVQGDIVSLQPGEFAVANAGAISVRLPAGLTPGAAVSLRLIVRGAESAPRWVTAP